MHFPVTVSVQAKMLLACAVYPRSLVSWLAAIKHFKYVLRLPTVCPDLIRPGVVTSLGNVLDGFKKLYISVLVCILSHAMVGCDHRCVRGVCIASVGCLHLSEPSHQKTEGCVEAANGVLPQSSQPASSSTRPQKERWHPAHGGIHSRSSHGGTALLLNCILSFPDWFGQAMNSACLDKLNTVRGFQKLTMSFSKWKIFMSGWVG